MTDAGNVALGEPRARAATLAYGFAHYGKSLFWYAGELLFAFFLTEIAGLPANHMGLVLAVGFLASAGLDIVVGSGLSSRLERSQAGRCQLIGALMATSALYWAPRGFQFPLALAANVVFRSAYALYDVPQNALLSLATTSARGRSNLAGLRHVFSGLASLTVAASIAPLMVSTSADARAVRFCLGAATLSVVAVGSAALLTRALRGGSAPAPAKPRPSGERVGRKALTLIGLMFVVSFGAPVFTRLEPYYAQFVIGDAALGAAILIAVALGLIVGQPAWICACRRLSRADALIAAAIALALAGGVFALASGRGAWPNLFAALLCGAAGGGLGMTLWAAFGDAVANGGGRQAFSFALFTASSKLSLAVSAGMIGWFFARIDYRGPESGALTSVITFAMVMVGAVTAGSALLMRRAILRRSDVSTRWQAHD